MRYFRKISPTRSIRQFAAKYCSQNVNTLLTERLSLADRISGQIADSIGSWPFIGSFLGLLLIWIFINSLVIFFQPFDPFPFTLLNLVLSCLAAVQAPIIMMSQNRQAEKDRIQADLDYEINRKSEVLIEAIIKRLERLEATQKGALDRQTKILKKLSR